jgi:hypothetical protein
MSTLNTDPSFGVGHLPTPSVLNARLAHFAGLIEAVANWQRASNAVMQYESGMRSSITGWLETQEDPEEGLRWLQEELATRIDLIIPPTCLPVLAEATPRVQARTVEAKAGDGKAKTGGSRR